MAFKSGKFTSVIKITPSVRKPIRHVLQYGSLAICCAKKSCQSKISLFTMSVSFCLLPVTVFISKSQPLPLFLAKERRIQMTLMSPLIFASCSLSAEARYDGQSLQEA